jgi:hypothetical protein
MIIRFILSCSTLFFTLNISSEGRNAFGRHQLSMDEVARILGEPALLVSRKDTTENNVYITKSTFSAKGIDTKSNKMGNLYYMFEQYNQEADAKNTYQSLFNSNKNSSGFEKLSDYGDDAFFHTDSSNFCLLFVRKRHKIVRLKVNKITPKTSVTELRKIGKVLIERI